MTLDEEGAELWKKFLEWLKRYLEAQKPPDPPPPVPGKLEGSPSSLAFLSPPGIPVPQTLTLKNTGGQGFSWTAQSADATLRVNPSSGAILPGAVLAVQVTVDAQFVPGVRQSSITFDAGSAGSVSVPVSITFTEAPPPPPPPPDEPPEDKDCRRPTGIKLGFRQNPPKRKLGYMNEADITSLVDGVAADPGCGPTYDRLYGEPQAEQDLNTPNGWKHEPIERASGDSYGCILRFATNADNEWVDGKYIYAGPMTVRVSWPWLDYWRCQDVTMGADGRLRGGDNSHSYDKPKV